MKLGYNIQSGHIWCTHPPPPETVLALLRDPDDLLELTEDDILAFTTVESE